MVKAIIELMLGKSGRFLLGVYNEYHVFLDVIVVAYGLALIWAHINLRRLVSKMEKAILDISDEGGTPPDPELVFEEFTRRWRASSGESKVLIPTRNDLWFASVQPQDLVEILGLQPDYVRVVLAKAEKIGPIDPKSDRVFRAWEAYRHQLRIGIRARYMEPEFQLKLRNRSS